MAPIRIYCDEPEYDRTWIALDERWTMGEMQRMVEAQGDEFYALLQSKTVTMHIQTNRGQALTNPNALSDEGLVDVDVLLLGWLGRVMPLAIARRRALGNASARLSLPTTGTPGMTTTPTMTAAPV